MFQLILIIVAAEEEKEEDQVKRNLQATLTMPLWAKKEADRNSMAKSYHYRLGKMIAKVKAETKWRDIFKIVEEAQKRLRRER